MDKLALDIFAHYAPMFEEAYEKSEGFRNFIDTNGVEVYCDIDDIFGELGYEVVLYSGSFKRVLWDCTYDYVVKFDYNCDNDEEDPSETEWKIWQQAEGSSVESHFAPIIKLPEYRGIKLWAMPFVEVDYDVNADFIYKSLSEHEEVDWDNEEEKNDFIDKISFRHNGYSEDVVAVIEYITVFHPQLDKFLIDNWIEDIHFKNFGIVDGRFVIIDYSL